MLCQHCNRNEADFHFLLQSGSGSEEINLCAACAEQLGKQYRAYLNGWLSATGQNRGSLSTGEPERGGIPSVRFPSSADEEFTRRRELAELRTQLKRAVDAEDYEEAATLRDKIHAVEKSGAVLPI